MAMNKHNTAEQSSLGKAQDHAENRMDEYTQSSWVHDKHDVKGAPDGVESPRDGQPTDAQPPARLTGLKLKEPEGYAAGVPGVLRAMKHLEMDAAFTRGSRALMVLNQKDGIDCMSCAWPEPDGKRRIAEFCESGAKAVAWETDSRRVTPEFFRDNTVAELAQRSDYWLGQQGRITHPMVLREGAQHDEEISWEDAFKLNADELNA